MRWTERLTARDRCATLLVVAFALLVRALWAHAWPTTPAWDGVLYERGAQAIARGLGYSTFMFEHRSSDTVATAYYPVGYSATLGAVYALFGASLAAQRALGIVVSAVSVGLAHRLAWRITSVGAARVGALVLALMPGQVVFAGAAMTEPLWGMLLIAAVYALVRREGAASSADLVLVAVILAFATYVRPQAALLAPVLPLLRTTSWGRGWRPRVLAALAVTLCVGALILPWSLRNCARLDGCAFVSTNGGSNLAIGAVPRANGRFFFLDASDGCRGVLGEVARDRCWRDVAVQSIRANPDRWLRLALVKLDHTLTYEAFPVGYLRESLQRDPRPASVLAPTTDARERTWRRILTVPWRVLLACAALALVPWPGRRRLGEVEWCVLGTLVVVLATHLLFFGGDRYHLPLVPLIAVLASAAFRDVRVVRDA